MDKYEFGVKVDQIKKLARQKDYAAAAAIADTIEVYRVKDNKILALFADVYEGSGKYEQAKEMLIEAYERTSLGRQIAYRLVKLCIKSGNISEAEEFYQDFIKVSPRDNSKYILQYELSVAKGAPIDKRIEIIETYLTDEMDEKWAFELAKLYHKAGLKDKCVKQCDDVILWFNDGKYVDKALELKMRYAPLTKSQQAKYEERWMAKAPSNINVDDIKIKEYDVNNKYNTVDIQHAIKESMDVIMNEGKYSYNPKEVEAAKEKEELEKTKEVFTEDFVNNLLSYTQKNVIVPKSEINKKPVEKEEFSEEPEDDQITGQMTIEEILEAYEEREKRNAEEEKKASEEQKKKEVEEAKMEVTAQFKNDMEVIAAMAMDAMKDEPDESDEPDEIESEEIESDEDDETYESEEVISEGNWEEEFSEDLPEEDSQEVSEEDLAEEDSAEEDSSEEVETEDDLEFFDEESETEDEPEKTESEEDAEYDDRHVEDDSIYDIEFMEDEGEYFDEMLKENVGESSDEVTLEEDFPGEMEEMTEMSEMEEIEGSEESLDADNEDTEGESEELESGEEEPNESADDGELDGEKVKSIIKDFVSKYSGMKGLDRQLLKVLHESIVNKNTYIFIVGEMKSGKTSLGIDLIKIINRIRQTRGRKIAKISGDTLVSKNIADYFEQTESMDIIVEKVGNIPDEKIPEVVEALKNKSDEDKIVVFEDERTNADNLLALNEELESLFELKIFVKQNRVRDWAEHGRKYAEEKGYSIDEMGMLALHAKIDDLYAISIVINNVQVESLINNAIHKSKNRGLGKILKLFGKEREHILREEDF